jgi:chemotaxis protein CheX
MTTIFNTESYQAQLDQIVADVMSVMYTATAHRTLQSVSATGGYTASVGFVGEWRGALLIRCSAETAEGLTKRLLNLEPVSPEEVADATGELANMIGGNLKSVLPTGVALTVPVVVAGQSTTTTVCRGGESSSTNYSCEAGNLEISLVREAQ